MADEALAVLADRYEGGAINNTRVAIRKVRGTRCGYEISFDLEVVTLGENYDREPITTCVVKWQTDGTSAVAVAASKERPSARLVYHFGAMPNRNDPPVFSGARWSPSRGAVRQLSWPSYAVPKGRLQLQGLTTSLRK